MTTWRAESVRFSSTWTGVGGWFSPFKEREKSHTRSMRLRGSLPSSIIMPDALNGEGGSIAFEIFIVVTLVTLSCSNRLVVQSAPEPLIDWLARWPVKLQIRQRAVFACCTRRREESEHITLAALNQPNERLRCFIKPAVVKQLAVQKVTVIPWCCSRPLCPRTERKERNRVRRRPVGFCQAWSVIWHRPEGLEMRRKEWVCFLLWFNNSVSCTV